MGPKKISSAQESVRIRVGRFLDLNPSMEIKKIVHHFELEGIPKRTIYDIIKRYKEGSSMERKTGSGRTPEKINRRKLEAIKKYFDGKDGVSQRSAASKFNISQQYVSKILRTKTNIQCFKKKKTPIYTEEQLNKLKTLSRRLYRKSSSLDFVIDDEHYFLMRKPLIPSNRQYYTSYKENASTEVKFYKKEKFQKKLMIWICMSPKGLSPAFFLPSKQAVNQHIYKNECLKKFLVPFINEHYPNGGYIFWPDKASSHYAKSVIDFLKEKKVNYVEKVDNPTNLPQARPIEDFFGILDQMVYANGFEAKTLKQLQRRVKFCLRKVDKSLVQEMMEKVRKLLRKMRRQRTIFN